MERPEGYPTTVDSDSDMEICRRPLFGRLDSDSLSSLESGRLYKRSYSDMGDNHHRIQESALRFGKSFDPRLLLVLEFFREFYFRRKELVSKIFPALQIKDLFNKIGKALPLPLPLPLGEGKVKLKTMQRSLSLGSPRLNKNQLEEEEEALRMERFRIRTVHVDDDVQQGGCGQGGGGGGQGGGADAATKPPTSK